MSVQRIEKIEQIIIKDPESPTGLTSVGFNTYYTNCIYVYSQIFFHSREIAFIDRKNVKTSVELDHKIEDIDIYHEQFGIHKNIIAFLSAHGQKAYFAVIKRLEKLDGIIS